MGMPVISRSMRTFFIATTLRVAFSNALKTTPYVPEPMMQSREYKSIDRQCPYFITGGSAGVAGVTAAAACDCDVVDIDDARVRLLGVADGVAPLD
jgi:hypothetical protein